MPRTFALSAFAARSSLSPILLVRCAGGADIRSDQRGQEKDERQRACAHEFEPGTGYAMHPDGSPAT